MHLANVSGILAENTALESELLQREVTIDLFIPGNLADLSQTSLLLINDGQNLAEMQFQSVLEKLYAGQELLPLICIGIHAGVERKMEYGIASQADYLGRGAKAGSYTSFIFKELLPFIYQRCKVTSFKEKAFAGFSLGGLSALDIVLNHPDEFNKAGVFSGSFWWRSVDQHDKEYDDDKHRIMQQQVRSSKYSPSLKFFFQCGNKDETRDRNLNGIIDSVDDTLDMMKELTAKGYEAGKDIVYMEMKDGRHDIATWARAMPYFLKWGWGRS